MKNKRGIYGIIAFAFFLGCFFQWARVDGFLYLSPSINPSFSMLTRHGEMSDAPREKYLILYDPADIPSMYARYDMERILRITKKDFDSRSALMDVDLTANYRGVFLATGQLARVPALAKLIAYVENGGSLAVLSRISSPAAAPLSGGSLAVFGIATTAEQYLITPGITLSTDFMIGGKDFSFAGEGREIYTTVSNEVTLLPEATVHIASAKNTPLLWEHRYGKGKIFVWNGEERDDKTMRGVRTALMAHMGDEGLYPIVGAKVLFIDDFPAPVPEGIFPKIYEETGLTTPEFYNKEWWALMKKLGREEHLKCTGLVIETYDANVYPPFVENTSRAARDNFVVFGRELLAAGGELGIHGYNHQSLAPAGYNQEELGYAVWESKENMAESLRALRSYLKELYPSYAFVSYVPPSNILSPEGKEAIREVFPEMKIYASLFDGLSDERVYIQEFGRNANGTLEIPRVTSGYIPTGRNMWEQISVNNYIGIFSHFVHPDEIFYEESKDLTWQEMKDAFPKFIHEINARFGWEEMDTASECGAQFENYLDADYRVVRTEDAMEVFSWGYARELRYILTSSREAESVDGGTLERLSPNTYLLRTKSDHVKIHWAK